MKFRKSDIRKIHNGKTSIYQRVSNMIRPSGIRKADHMQDATFGCKEGEAIFVDANSNYSEQSILQQSKDVASDGHPAQLNNTYEKLEFERSHKKLNSEVNGYEDNINDKADVNIDQQINKLNEE